MSNFTFKYQTVIPLHTKVIFDTNAYRNFVEQYLADDVNFLSTIETFKDCERRASVIPSSNLLSVMELYQHLSPEDPAYGRCKKAILFSFQRSLVDNKLEHQPLPEIEISDKLFNTVADEDMQLNGYLLEGHIRFCSRDVSFIDSTDKFVRDVVERLKAYKEASYNSIINNLQRLFSSFNPDTLKFSEGDYKKYKEKFGKDRISMYLQLGTILFQSFQKRLNITNYRSDKHSAIVNLICDCQPALFSYIKMWENFYNNNHNSKAPFTPNKNDLIDSFILFSIVPDNNILLITNERKIHSIFKEIGKSNSVATLDEYLKVINFIPISNK